MKENEKVKSKFKSNDKTNMEGKHESGNLVNYLQVMTGYDVTFYRKRLLGMTVCLVSQGQDIVVRGVAICSPKDQFSIKDGRAWAVKAAKEAFQAKANDRRIFTYRDNVDRLRYDVAYAMFGYHSCFAPHSTFEEQKILKLKEKEKNSARTDKRDGAKEFAD